MDDSQGKDGSRLMKKYIIRRILSGILTIFIVFTLTFILIKSAPGDPIRTLIGQDNDDPVLQAALEEKWGLNKSLPEQYFAYLSNAVQGDLGTSIVTGKPVWDELMSRYPNTLILAFGGIVVAAIGGILVGILAAVFHNKFWDNCIMVLSMLAVSTPSFFLALILMLVFTLNLRWFPSMGAITPARMVLPIITLGTQAIGFIARTTRSAIFTAPTRTSILKTSSPM